MLKMRIATFDDINRIEDLYYNCVLRMTQKGIYQWDNKYPNRYTYIDSITNNCHYVFDDENELLIGSVILNEKQSEEWKLINWKYTEGKQLRAHALAIAPSAQGQGYGQEALELCQLYGVNHGYSAIRIDVFSGNPTAIGLYEKNAFEKVGEVNFAFKPEGHQLYYCYEKKLI